ncbi:FecCD family ABC transporter permease [Nonlabens ponticola]|uniref:Iron ABC transporter permease n=1 Tax=Nonlabens ponticola TaxID=2496866 RepID=A0A3S9MZ68_9FLAO|nr:iron ABC transporter permease [Nonlabens ponticola]AZQ44551.1 iron ABC transporter permease [Nonlabens ponticola]
MRKRIYLILILLLAVLFIADCILGSVYIPIDDLWSILFSSKQSTDYYIITQLRLPRAIMAVITGAGLSIAGLLMQTLFKNPLAGPFVLGISSGAGLGVAIAILGGAVMGYEIVNNTGIIISSILGSLAVFMLIILISLRIKDTMGLLIIGLMVGSLSSAVVGILQYLSPSEQLQRYVFWGLGSLGNLTWQQLGIIAVIITISLIALVFLIKPLNALLLGENYARSLGINIPQTRWLVIIITCLLAGTITAFAGPIAFIGLAIPHIARQLIHYNDHKTMIPLVIILGAIVLLICDMVSQVPFSNFSLPINAVTSIIGAPLVIWLIVKKRYLRF